MSIPRRIPATIVTGFLGAGKTSLLRHLLMRADGRRLALIINEFGDIGIDGELLKACGSKACGEEDIVELTNGCLCCTVADDFLPTIQALLDRDNPPDHIVIETSGLALPKPLVKAFAWPEVKSRVTVDGVIAVVDGRAVLDGRFAMDEAALAAQKASDPGLDHDNPLEEVFEDQLACADLVVLNKADLMAEGDRNRLSHELAAELRPAVKVVAAIEGRLDPALLLGLSAAAEDDLAARPSHHETEAGHDHDDFESFVLDLPAQVSPEPLARRLEAVLAARGVLRVKGFAEVSGKPARLVLQGVGSRLQHYFDRTWHAGEPRQGRVVVIGLRGLDRAAVQQALAA